MSQRTYGAHTSTNETGYDANNTSSLSTRIDIRSVISWFINIIKDSSTFAKVIAGACATFSILSIIYPVFPSLLTNDAWSVMYYSEWYRTLTAPYANRNILQAIVGIFFFLIEYRRVDAEQGSLVAIFDFMVKNFLINLTYIQFEMYLYPKIFERFFLAWGSYGLFGVTYTYILEAYLRDENTTVTLFARKYNIKQYFYIYLVAVTVASFGFRPADLIAGIVGFVYFHILDPMLNDVKSSIQGYSIIDPKSPKPRTQSKLSDHEDSSQS